MRAALYLRVSTDEQAREGHSIVAQRDRLLAFCRSQGWTVVDIYSEEGVSGAELDRRPELRRLRKDVKDGRIDLVLVWKVDRLSRRLAHLAKLVDEFDQHGCGIRSVTEPFDTTHAAGRMMLQLLGVFAEFEREMIRERITAGIRQRTKEGHLHGRPVMLGYKAPGGGQVWQVHEQEAKVVRWIYDQYLAGVGSMRIAQGLKEGAPGLPKDVLKEHFGHIRVNSASDRVRWILKNPTYAGYVRLDGDLIPGRHEAIIPEDTWWRVQRMFEARRGMGPRSKTSPYILSGLLFCGACGGKMWGTRRPRVGNRGPYRYYICANSTLQAGRLKTCTNWGVRKEHVEGEVLGAIRRLTLPQEQVAAAVPEAPEEDEGVRRLRDLRAELTGVRRRQQNLISTIERAPDVEDAVLDRLRDLADEQRRLQAEIAALEGQEEVPRASREELSSMLAHVGQIIDHADVDELRELVRMFVRRALVMPAERRGAKKEVRVELYPL